MNACGLQLEEQTSGAKVCIIVFAGVSSDLCEAESKDLDVSTVGLSGDSQDYCAYPVRDSSLGLPPQA